ncbi:MAG: ABC transporter ATP-binding protein [Oscillospiraceae bacterium]|nr:ABC transporter ATP-binding protein [Oscillospiraceae bacterium]
MLNNILVELKHINFDYDGDVILDGLNLFVNKNEFLTLLGPSGCGKTTTLRLIGGFIFPKSGVIYFEGNNITKLPPHKRNLNTVFQRYALFPHLNLFDNVAFGLKLKKFSKDEIKKKVDKMLKIVNLTGYENRKTEELSGGQQQRVAIARALVNNPKILLLDEPLGALDLKLRKEMQIELKNIQKEAGVTFIYVTHDQEEALTMSDRIIIMKDGEIQQIGTPEDVYNEPKNAFVADFIGESNIMDGIMLLDRLVEIKGKKFKCVDIGFNKHLPVDVVVRPEDINLVFSPTFDDIDNEYIIFGKVINIIFKGVHYEITVSCDGIEWIVHTTINYKLNDSVYIEISPENIHIMEKMFKGESNIIDCFIEDIDTISFMGKTFKKPNHNFSSDDKLEVSILPNNIYIVSEDHSDIVGFLESLIYKGSYNELIFYTDKGKIMVHSQQEEQLGTYIGLKFDLDNIIVSKKGVK